jgi:hypothetical protein
MHADKWAARFRNNSAMIIATYYGDTAQIKREIVLQQGGAWSTTDKLL